MTETGYLMMIEVFPSENNTALYQIYKGDVSVISKYLLLQVDENQRAFEGRLTWNH